MLITSVLLTDLRQITMSFSGVHSCVQLVAENDKLKHLIRKVKKENNELREKLQDIEDIRKVESLMKSCVTTRNMEVQTEPRGYSAYQPYPLSAQHREKKSQQQQDKSKENEKMNKMLTMYNNLMRRYEKELKLNVDHVETITKLNLKINSLEVKLKESEMEIHELKVGKRLSTARSKVRSKSAGSVRHKTRALDITSDSEVSGLLEEFNQVRKERDQLRKEKKKLQEVVQGLDRSFFEEIEDLKYALQQSAKLNKEYEKSLRKMCTKFGVPFPTHGKDAKKL